MLLCRVCGSDLPVLQCAVGINSSPELHSLSIWCIVIPVLCAGSDVEATVEEGEHEFQQHCSVGVVLV